MGVYLPPEVLYYVQQGDDAHNSNYDKYKVDVFTLGMVLLETIHLKDQNNIFDYNKITINRQKLNKSVDDTKANYSPLLSEILHKMVELDETVRPDFEALYKIMQESKISPSQSNQ